MGVQSYRDLVAWQQSMALVKHIYKASENWPPSEMYGLTAQVRRAAVSIPSNIAEGQGRRTTKDFVRHLSIAYGSLLEAETQLLLARDLGFLEQAVLDTLLSETAQIGRVLNGLTQTLEAKQPRL